MDCQDLYLTLHFISSTNIQYLTCGCGRLLSILERSSSKIVRNKTSLTVAENRSCTLYLSLRKSKNRHECNGQICNVKEKEGSGTNVVP